MFKMTLYEIQNRRAYNHREEKASKYPTYLNIETIAGCNLRCVMCPIGTGDFTRPNKIMDMGLFKKIVDEASGNIRYSWLHWFGEPFLDPHIFERIKYAKSKGIKTQISSNITRLTEEKARQVLESGLDEMILSLDGATKRTYESIRVMGNYEETMANAERFLRMKKEGGYKKPWARVQIIKMHENEQEIQAFVEKWKDLADEIIIKPLITWAGQVNVSAQQTQVYKIPERYPCFNLWEQITISAEGVATICCYDFNAKYVIGDLKTQSIEEIYNGKRMTELRQFHIDGKYPAPCDTCMEWAWPKPQMSVTKELVRGALEDFKLYRTYQETKRAIRGKNTYLPAPGNG